ncbi:MAG: hypothetical protein U0531_15405 [Dehalococcoidia bacterium]
MPHFVKSHGLGNDYIVMEPDKLPFALTEENIRLICHRNLGVGSDGILAMATPVRGDFAVRIYNPDGSEAEKSGNGTRIYAKYLYDYGYTTKTRFTIDTLGRPCLRRRRCRERARRWRHHEHGQGGPYWSRPRSRWTATGSR